MTVRRLKAGGQSIKTKLKSFNEFWSVKIFLSVKALSFTSASSGSMPDRSTVDGIIFKFSISVF